MKRFITKAILFFILIEVFLRIIYSFIIGPDILLFGTRFYHTAALTKDEVKFMKNTNNEGTHNVASHSNVQNGYTKYLPNQKRRDHDKKGNIFDVRINAQGFRGEDFKKVKDDGTFRIISIGASPTFGYGDRDNETYPYYLQEILKNKLEQCSSTKIEVYNMGIPHLTSDEILALFEKEALSYNPDLVLFYGGMTDTPIELKETLFDRLSIRLVLVKLFSLKWKQKNPNDLNYFKKHYQTRCQKFLGNLTKINERAKAEGISFYYITQQSQSKSLTKKQLQKTSYLEEKAIIQEKIATQPVTDNELFFLIHTEIIKNTLNATDSLGIQVIDGLSALDTIRHELTSWVHLSPKGNQCLSGEIARRIYNDELVKYCKD